MEILKFGTVYIDEFPAPVSYGLKYYESDKISIGDTVGNRGIWWIRLSNGLLIADRCIFAQISWEQLDSIELVFGKVIQIDGKWYLCRCLKVGAKEGDPNEWDTALDEAGDDDGIWHWKGQYFWGQETPEGWASLRAIRGYHWARNWSDHSATYRYANVGFRPALEPLIPAPLDYDPMVGTKITPMGPDNKFVSGMLVSASDYDLVLETRSPLPGICKWAIPDGEQVIIDRASVSWLRQS